DVLTRDTFRRSNLYEHYYRHVGIEFQIGVVFASPCGGVFSVVLSRETHDFSDRDRALLDLLLPHLIQGPATVATLTGLQGEVAALEQGVDLANVGIVFLDHERRIQAMSLRSRRLLAAYFGHTPGSANVLPAKLDGWVAHETRAAERIVPSLRLL